MLFCEYDVVLCLKSIKERGNTHKAFLGQIYQNTIEITDTLKQKEE